MQQALGGLNSSFNALAVGAAAAGAVLAGALGAGLRSSISAAMEAETAAVRLEAVLRAGGNAARVSTTELMSYATEMQRLTGIEDEQIIAAESTIAAIAGSGAQLKTATGLALDLSAALGKDLTSTSLAVAKALESPTEGLTALQRVGVRFTETEQEMIEKLIEGGKVTEAQSVILDRLRSKVGGVAEELGKTSSGQLNRFRADINDLQEKLGMAALRGFDPLLQRAIAWAESDAALKFTEDLAQELSNMFDNIGNVISALDDLRSAPPIRKVIELVDGFGNMISIGAMAALGFKVVGPVVAAGTAGATLGAQQETNPTNGWFETLQEVGRVTREMLGLSGDGLLERAGIGGESAADRAARQAAHLSGEGGYYEAPGFWGPSLGQDPTRPVSATNPVAIPGDGSTRRGPSASSGGGKSSTKASGPTAFSAASLGLIEQITSGLPDFTGGLDAAGIEEFRAAEAEFKAIRAGVNRDLAQLGLAMADLDARGLENTDTFKGLEDRAGAMKDALSRIDLIEDLRLTPWKDAIDAVSESIEKNLAAQKQMADSLFEMSKQFLNVRIAPGAQQGLMDFFGQSGGRPSFGANGEFGFGVDVVVP